MRDEARYITGDRDLPDTEQKALVIIHGHNGDWYVQIAPKDGRTTDGVRLCTSGGASTRCPGLTQAIADAFQAIISAQCGKPVVMRPRVDLEDEVRTWRAAFPNKVYANGQLYDVDQ